ncbi:MAG: GNAT family N-acetyltransferase [Muribaculaceae bacterium]|nr:GNAT family N-acetyltransferase [Muribaculaceae bacterium]MDE7369725.1 GNAT family N-acetyltransferase [Muribaculaceae bacterium]
MTPAIEIAVFDREKHSREWDRFIGNETVNATFIHNRNYIGYHGNRFDDCSLVFRRDNRIVAVIPAVKNGKTFESHPGLTFGGILIGKKCRHNDIATIIDLTKSFLKEQGIEHLVLTLPPYIYQSHPVDDIPYLLSISEGELTRRRLLSVIDLTGQPEYSTLRKRGVKKAISNGLKVDLSNNLKSFYEMLVDNLATRYNTTPVHTLKELKLLASLFPDNIKLMMTFDGNKAVAGSLVYVSKTVIKTQYIASTEEGRNHGAVDLLLTTIIDEAHRKGKRFVDLGSSENEPNEINHNLLFQKEGFGSHGVCIDTYTLIL